MRPVVCSSKHRVLALLTGIALIPACSLGAQAAKPRPGKPKYECKQNIHAPSDPGACSGFPEAPLADGSSDAKAVKWLMKTAKDNKKWGRAVSQWRKGAPGKAPTYLTVQAIRGLDSIDVENVTSHGLVLAKIVPEPGGSGDSRYGLGADDVVGMQGEFFFVVTGYTGGNVMAPSYKIGTWAIYGLTTGSKPTLKVMSSGALHQCSGTHLDQSTITTRFNGCDDAHFAMAAESKPGIKALLGGRRLTEAVLSREYPVGTSGNLNANDVLRLMQGEWDGPAWILCGTGCCTFEGGLRTTGRAPTK
ncbi:MAG: hypothetical protein K2R93_01855 [Gemmatimonadaceae bacterium]|nr:hypothetical protein [Gemmatimonadaceae bacterium]